MPKVIKRTYRSSLIKRKKRRYSLTKRQMKTIDTIVIVLCIFLVAIGIGSFLSQSTVKTVKTTTTPHLDAIYSVVGNPTISVDLINEELSAYHSPAQGSGQALYDYGEKYHIDPVYALAFFMEESNLGTKGVATQTHSLGNIRATVGAPAYNGYRLYSTWVDGFAGWYQLIAETYVKDWNLTTVDQIIPIYAPSGDNNNERAYISTIKYLVNEWRTEEQNSQI